MYQYSSFHSLAQGGVLLQTYLVVTPEETTAASRFSRSLAHAAYRIGPDSTLLRQNLLLQTWGGLLTVCDQNCPTVSDPSAVAAAALRECARRSYTGIFLDFEETIRPDLADLIRKLETVCAEKHLALYLPEHLASLASKATLLIGTALSGGNYTQRLQEAKQQYAGHPLALDVQRVRMDFTLPAPSGEGEPLSPAQLEQLMQAKSPATFFSQDLCARYFTYAKKGTAHFVLFDDAESMKRKVRIGASLGYTAAFFLWPEVEDLAGQLGLS